jgi:hypothetical protein
MKSNHKLFLESLSFCPEVIITEDNKISISSMPIFSNKTPIVEDVNFYIKECVCKGIHCIAVDTPKLLIKYHVRPLSRMLDEMQVLFVSACAYKNVPLISRAAISAHFPLYE